MSVSFQQKARVVFGRRSLLRISKLLLWPPVAGGAGFHNMMDAPFTKLVAVYQLVLWMLLCDQERRSETSGFPLSG